MTPAASVAQALRWGAARLERVGIEEARLDARVLLQACLGLDYAGLAVSLRRTLQPDDLAAYRHAIERRAAREPLAYVVGHREFFGLDLGVDARVLVPRPETELLVEEALRVLQTWGYGLNPPSSFPPLYGAPPRSAGRPVVEVAAAKGALTPALSQRERVTSNLPPLPLGKGRGAGSSEAPCLVDVGTGSGAIAISLAKRCPSAFVYALDVSADALAVAASNARRHDVENRLAFLQGDLLEPLAEPADLIVANLPYVTTTELASPQPEVAREPRLALDGGSDGLAVYRRLLEQAPRHLRAGGALLFEIGASQGPAAIDLTRHAFPNAPVRLVRDLAGHDRVVVVETA